RVRRVLGVVPTGAESELDASVAHGVGLRNLDRERAREPERDRCDERAQTDARGLAPDRREGHPRVGRTRSRGAVADPLEMIGTEERVEAEPFGGLRDAEQLFVGRALLGFSEDTQSHAARNVVLGSRTMPGVLTVDHWPELRQPVMVVALSGWVDAGI